MQKPAQPTCAKPSKAYLAECKKKLDPETQDDGGNPIADGLKGLANAIDKYLLSLNVGKYEGPPTDPDEDGCVYRETGKGVLRAKVNPFGVSVARVTIGWVKSKEKKVGEEWEVVPPPVGEGLVQYTILGDLAGKEKEPEESPPLSEEEEGKIKSCLEKVKEIVGNVKVFIETYLIKIGVGPGNGLFTITVNLGGLEWVYVSCLKAGEGLTTVRSLGFVNKKKPQPPA